MFVFLNSYLSPLFARAFVVFCLFLFSNSVFSQSTDLSLQGIIDFTVPGGGNAGKAIHVKAINSIPDLSIYGIGQPTDLTNLSPVAWYRMGDGITSFPTIPDVIGTNDGTAYNENESTMVVPDVP